MTWGGSLPDTHVKFYQVTPPFIFSFLCLLNAILLLVFIWIWFSYFVYLFMFQLSARYPSKCFFHFWYLFMNISIPHLHPFHHNFIIHYILFLSSVIFILLISKPLHSFLTHSIPLLFFSSFHFFPLSHFPSLYPFNSLFSPTFLLSIPPLLLSLIPPSIALFLPLSLQSSSFSPSLFPSFTTTSVSSPKWSELRVLLLSLMSPWLKVFLACVVAGECLES